jgi:Nif-specific regulatory protein
MSNGKSFPVEALQALVDASAAINGAMELPGTLHQIALAAAAVMRAEDASVIMLDEVRGKQVFSAAVGDFANRLIGLEYDAGVGISAKVLETGEALIVNDVASERSHYKQIDEITTKPTRSLIAAPLIHQGDKLGVVEVLNPIHAELFGPRDLELCRIFANLAAIATANAQLRQRLRQENTGLKEVLRGSARMIGESGPMQRVRELIARVAASSATVLLLGETGTGKELAARLVHDSSDRASGPFIAVNCAALPATLLESELFGHEAGAFTGATGRRLGRFQLADGGTIFLDEIAEAPLEIQVKLLRVLESHEVTPLGGTAATSCDVRVVTATNRDLGAEVSEGRFRGDLYYRLNVFPIRMPPLRERRGDIPLLISHFVQTTSAELKRPAPTVSPEAVAALTAHDYPGNVRELANIIERACLLCRGGEGDPAAGLGGIRPEHLPQQLAEAGTDSGAARPAACRSGGSALAELERSAIVAALAEHDWNQTRAARSLGISRDNLRYRIKKYDIRR